MIFHFSCHASMPLAVAIEPTAAIIMEEVCLLGGRSRFGFWKRWRRITGQWSFRGRILACLREHRSRKCRHWKAGPKQECRCNDPWNQAGAVGKRDPHDVTSLTLSRSDGLPFYRVMLFTACFSPCAGGLGSEQKWYS